MLYREPYCFNYGKKDEHKEKEDSCVEINIRCVEKEPPKKDEKPWSKPEYEKDFGEKEDYGKKHEDRKEKSCVVINIFCEQKEEKEKEPRMEPL